MSASANSHRVLLALPASRALLDAAVTMLAFAGTLVQLSRGGMTPAGHQLTDLDPIGILLVACSTLPILGWRRFPLGVFVVTSSASVLLAGLGYPIDLLLGPTAALFLLAGSRGEHHRWTSRISGIVVGLFIAYLVAAAVAHRSFPGFELLHSGLALAGAWFAGERTRLRREQLVELKDQAMRAERGAERERLLAVAEERARIARDLHDTAGHAINVIAIRAGAARLRHHQDPGRSLLALGEVEDLARQTAEEIDHIVAALREKGSDADLVEAPHGLASLCTLIELRAATGLQVTLESIGAPRRLAVAADQAAYRILQEALTNAARHGAGTVKVRLTFEDHGLGLTVANPVSETIGPPSRTGHGLVGMRERVSLMGGRLDAAAVDGVFRVQAVIPYGDH